MKYTTSAWDLGSTQKIMASPSSTLYTRITSTMGRFWNRMTSSPPSNWLPPSLLVLHHHQCTTPLHYQLHNPLHKLSLSSSSYISKMFVHLYSLYAIRSASNYQHQLCERPIGLLLFWVRAQKTCSGEEDFWRTKAKNWINDVESGEEKQSSQLEEPSGSLFSWIPISPGWRWYFCPGSQLSLFVVWWWRLIGLAKFHRLLGHFNPRCATRELLCRWPIRENFLWHSVFLCEEEMTDVWSS